MSGVVKGVKKVFKAVTKIPKAIGSAVNKVHKKLRQSKIYKIALGAAAIYFGGAALLSMAGGGTAAAGLGSAWGGLQGAGSAVMAGNFSGAVSAIGSGFTGGAAAGAGATFAAGQAATTAAINGATTAAAATGGGITASAAGGATTAAPTSAQLTSTLNTGLFEGVGQAGLQSGNLVAGASNAAGAASTTLPAAAPQGLMAKAWGSLGEAGKASLITAGVNTAGQMIQGYSQQRAAEEAEREARRRMTYFGMDGDGNTVGLPNYAQVPVGLMTQSPGTQSPGSPFTPSMDWQTTMDTLIKRQRNLTGA